MAELKEERSRKHRSRSVGFCQLLRKMILNSILFMRYYFDLVIDKIFGLYFGSPQVIPPPSDPLVLESANSLAEKIKSKKVTVERVVSAYITRIKEVNEILNAVVDNRFEEAVQEARQLDKDIAIGDINESDFQLKPFLGIPFTTKESTAAKGLSHTFGLNSRIGKKASEDAEAVKLMKEAGGILLGVTNVPQLNMWQETYNPIFGTTNNPYNTTRNVGGSSGGEASIIAACGSAIGIGSDIGGSLRIPAFMCGIFGHKPTCNLISTRGFTFRTGKEKDTMVVPGPMTRYAEDIIPLLKVLIKENISTLRLDEPVNIDDIRVFYINDLGDPFISPTRSDMEKAFKSVLNYFHDILPTKPEKLKLEGTKFGGKIWRYWMTQEPNANFRRDLKDRSGEVTAILEILKFVFRISEYPGSTIFNLINGLLPQENAYWALEQTRKLRNELTEKLGESGVLLYPSGPWPASYHHTSFMRPWNFNVFCIWNALKFPVTQVPLGLSKEGLPLGIQVVAAPHQDRLAIAVAKFLEKKFGGYVPPFSVSKEVTTLK